MNAAIPHMSGPGGGVVPRAQLPGVLLYHGPEESRYVLRRSLSDHLLFHLSSRLPLERSHLTGKGGGGGRPPGPKWEHVCYRVVHLPTP